MSARFTELESVIRLILRDEPVVFYDLTSGSSSGAGFTLLLDSDTGVSMADLTRYAKLIHYNPEINALYPQGVRLEVSSPGIHRPLRQPWHYQKVVGRPVKVALKDALEGRKNFEGTLTSAQETDFTVATPQGDLTFSYSQVKQAKTNDEFFTGAAS